ncbi:MAG: hypothetical protein LAT77_02035 [Aliidiomarina sp.]|uniref:hypothetical protein n=1 Tax=Aliidiomarina sp. TaxID=1872439 RepID=UPI0025BA57B9|nr:hypothetical protein [Aliidiomarina sp.]MCH8500671.1 hypothetical protein [Aliidiomarina sp.]
MKVFQRVFEHRQSRQRSRTGENTNKWAFGYASNAAGGILVALQNYQSEWLCTHFWQYAETIGTQLSHTFTTATAARSSLPAIKKFQDKVVFGQFLPTLQQSVLLPERISPDEVIYIVNQQLQRQGIANPHWSLVRGASGESFIHVVDPQHRDTADRRVESVLGGIPPLLFQSSSTLMTGNFEQSLRLPIVNAIQADELQITIANLQQPQRLEVELAICAAVLAANPRLVIHATD